MGNIGAVVIYGGEAKDTSTLEINYYVKRICEAYAKIYILEEVCRIYLETPRWKFMIEPTSPSVNPAAVSQKKRKEKKVHTSAPLKIPPCGFNAAKEAPGKAAIKLNRFDAKSIDPLSKEEMVQVDIGVSTLAVDRSGSRHYDLHKEADSALFFEHFRKVQRPVVHFVQQYEPPVLLFDHFGRDALQLKELSFNSPFETAFNGIVGLIELLLKQNMQREAHELEQKLKTLDIGLKTLELAEKIAHIYKVIEDPSTSYPMKQFLLSTLNGVLDQQAKLNSSMGITRIDFEGQGSLDMRV